MSWLIDFLTSALWVILALGVLIFIHELGHFLTAKWFGMRVERFSIGFPPKLFGVQKGETEYVVGATPLGGYVKISGMIDESLDTEQMDDAPEPWEFRAKPVWQRIIVITAGVAFNMLLAGFIFGGLKWAEGDTYIPMDNIQSVYVADSSIAYDMGLRTGDRIFQVNGTRPQRFSALSDLDALLADTLTITVARGDTQRTFVGPPNVMTRASQDKTPMDGPLGISFLPSVVGRVQSGMPADSIGLRPGDRIVRVGSDSVRFWQAMAARIEASKGAPLAIAWVRPDSLRDGTPPDSTAAPVVQHLATGTLYADTLRAREQASGRYLVGIGPATRPMLESLYGVKSVAYGPTEAIVVGTKDAWAYASNIVTSLKRIATGRDDLRQNLGGPVRIAQVTSQAAEAGWGPFWRIVAILSVTLAVMNLLPIPALDGGQLMFLIYEGITRRRPSTRVRLVAQQIGMVLLLCFMAFLIFNDILRL
ncbi:RIP metalloprotease RseP [Salisaeta longa]|uniref:RIP metalloprotease RseP n=1 Tax=Salisaeta longa TaxID=503170 RepID=UPI0003B5DDA6|nr:RIP metalloprotease RseP [Salisaeta longa]